MSATQLLAEQYMFEEYSALIYNALAAWLEIHNYDGLAHWFHHHMDEERVHADKMYHHLIDRNILPEFWSMPRMDFEFVSGLEVFKRALDHEKLVTSRIRAIAEAASEEHDHVTYAFIQPFILEQVEEEDTLSSHIGRLESSGNLQLALFVFDQELREDD